VADPEGAATAPAGRTVTVSDRLDPARAAALQAVLGMPGRPPGDGDTLIPFGHRIYFWEALPPWSLAADGTAAPGSGLLADFGPGRPVWAGGALTWEAPLRLGRAAVRVSTVEPAAPDGALAGAIVSHRIEQDGALILTERQLFRLGSGSGPEPVPPQAPDAGAADIDDPALFDAVTLFRYAALCLDARRSHYDLDHARGTALLEEREVPVGLLVQSLVLMAEARLGPLLRFAFRVRAPLCLGQEAGFCAAPPEGSRLRLWLRGPEGRLCLTAEAEAAGRPGAGAGEA
jgi:3-methylfumaryl-CoA hydratase